MPSPPIQERIGHRDESCPLILEGETLSTRVPIYRNDAPDAMCRRGPMPEDRKDDWLKPKTHYTKSHVYRQRTRMERGLESVMKDFFGDEAEGEIERHQGEVQEMGPIIDDLLTEWRGDESVALRTLVERWHEVVGIVYKQHTRPGTLEDGVLQVEVFHAALLANLKPMEGDILEKVQAIIGDEVKAVRVVPGGRSSR